MMEPCPWCVSDPLYVAYHDTEWGAPLHDERRLFEFLLLEGAQAGLSWLTVLKKREGYRRAFDDFDAAKIAAYDDEAVARLLATPTIVRNRLKIEAAIANARALLKLYDEGKTLDGLLWQFVDGRPQINRFRIMSEVPPLTPTAEAMSKELKRRGFKFVGPTICYALMQAVGLVNDHLIDCPRHAELRGELSGEPSD
ncbi:MAG TPA: DNA-3-methyladenine glycosylase I [Rhodocyclaceae bacterium]|nr:DNA-3-methyladenine glycosylase I [Rhodocyclaceae bacterium]